ncbi:MAG: helix-turn-helix domain-containing protein [Clostridia bacterium]|nr:helix-turn-helix domain-containing protein [Clostridia bacterium]
MREQTLAKLTDITEEEQFILIEKAPDPKELYSRSGRFIIERRHMSSLSLGESTAAVCMRRHPRFREFPVHSHDYIEIMYVCDGSITHVIDKETVTLCANDLIILGKDTRHSILSVGENDIGINLIIATELFEDAYNKMKKNSQLSNRRIESLLHGDGQPYCVFSAENSLPVQNIMESMIEQVICERSADGYILRQSVGLLICYLSALFPEQTESDSPRESMKKTILGYIESSYSTATLTEAAEMLGLSPSYLCRLVREYFGVSFKKLLMSVRFETACGLLMSTDLPVGDIINRVGYENSSYFHKEFKKRFGMTPNNYRRSH